MPIPSLAFLLVFLPVCVGLYYALFFSRFAQNALLLLASLVFYAFGQAGYVLVLMLSIVWNYFMAIAIWKRKTEAQNAKALTVITAASNFLVLLAFLSFNPLQTAVTAFFGGDPLSFRLVLPLGLAIYTLQAAGYCIDVYRGEVAAEKNILYVGLYLAFFPKIITGPLISFSSMRTQMESRSHSLEKFSRGMCRFVIGLSKKLLLADQLSYLVNYLFTQAAIDNTIVQLPVALAWFGLLAFGLQLYYELSGFADMAIGLGLIFGFELPENYRYPFTAVHMADFWSRWNITALAWFRNYMFGALSKKSNKDLVMRDLLIVWILFALWFGGVRQPALIWGLWNFFFLLAEHFFGYGSRIPGRFLKHTYTLLVVAVGFVLLRSPTLYVAGRYLASLFWLNNNSFYGELLPVFLKEYWMPIGLGILFAMPVAPTAAALPLRLENIKGFRSVSTAIYTVCVTGLLALCIIYLLQDPAISAPVF